MKKDHPKKLPPHVAEVFEAAKARGPDSARNTNLAMAVLGLREWLLVTKADIRALEMLAALSQAAGVTEGDLHALEHAVRADVPRGKGSP